MASASLLTWRMEMIIGTKIENRQAIYSLEGRLDNQSAPLLEKALEESLGSIDKLVIDFAGVDYISSAGLRVLLIAKKRLASGEVVLRNVNEVVGEILDMAGFTQLLSIE